MHAEEDPPYILPSPLPNPPKKVKTETALPTTPPRTSLKRPAPDDSENVQRTAKRSKMNAEISSPSKKRRLEEDGLIMMEGANDRLEDDIIEID